ncbi:serine/threonine kinase 16 [Leptodontidium sp. MPI-SDFR-AT-0119]|nr:serine/threonine kinase 16 [Leptodontidium sp. MPI-SDFR-AT-0119]
MKEEELHELQHELHTEIYPGTEVMTDIGSHHFIKGNSASHGVLVPQPSDAANDPLNWSLTWKATTLACASVVTFAQAFGPLSLAPMFGDYMQEWNKDLADVIQLTNVAILVLGFSNFLWVPMMTSFGRRPTLIFSCLICFASSIWRARAKSYGSFLGACVLNGLGAGPAETAQPTIIADIFFLDDRGALNTLYFATYFGGLTIGPIIAGPMAHAVGWRNFWWLNTALLGAALLCSLFFFPETKCGQEIEERRKSTPKSNGTEHVKEGESQTGITEDIQTSPSGPGVLEPVQTAQDPFLGRGSPSKIQWKLFQSYEGNVFRELVLPWYLFTFPIVEFSAFVVSWSASVYLMTNLTQAEVFAAPPYNFTSTKIGYMNFATLVGSFIGLLTAGPLSDKIAAHLTRRNKGIREPEMRLWAMVPYILLMILGNVIVAVGYERQWHWAIIVIIGYTTIGIQVAALPAIASTYAIDSYKPVSGSIFVAITVNKNVWGYGFGKFITPWIQKSGYLTPILTNMALTTFFCSTGILFYYRGKTFRKWTKDSKVHNL